jgi:aminomuconate-semialdehyde/2-hydroxymuconate-6-semialdehyde dehydrogenase
MRTLQNYIAGELRPAADGATLEDRAPATDAVVATIPASGPADVDAAVDAAHRALEGPWGRSTVAERADLLDAVADAIEAQADELAALESLDTGKPVKLARAMDIARAIANFRFFAGAIRHDHTDAHEMSDALNYTLRRPLGVVGLITPWNLPLYLLSWKTAPALATGNAVVAKPSELTPLSASALADILHGVGLPPGAFNLVHGLGGSAGAALVSHPGVAAISFTGGTATGARVGAAASAGFKKLSLELGGKNATVVFADADPDLLFPGVLRASFTNQGQVCLCGSRILVERRFHDAFVDRFAREVEALRLGAPSDPATDLGSLVSIAHREKIEFYVALARAEGGTVVTGGSRPSFDGPLAAGAFYRPTVITGLSPTSRVAQEEIFGPVVTVHPFDTDVEAVAIANGVSYGLSASVWTRDLARAHRISAALDVGMVWVNTWLKRDLRVPFGGVKASGVGREGGDHSLSFYTNDKNVCVQL